MREESFVFEGRNGNGVNVAQVIWFDRPNVIAKAATQDKAGKDCRKDRFHGAGEAAASGEADVSGAGDTSELVAVPGEGDGAWSFAESGVADPRLAIRSPDAPPFLLEVPAVATIG